MATDPSNEHGPPDAEAVDALPEDSVLDLEDYLDMHKAIGHPTRYRILRLLVNEGDMPPKEIEAALEIDDSTAHYHLNELQEAHLVRKWMRTERSRDGTYTYYSATIYGRSTLEDGVQSLIQGEHGFHDMYADS